MPGSHGEGHDLAVARCRGEHRNPDYRVIRDVARLEHQWPLLCPSGITIFQPRQDRPRSGGRLSRTQGDECGRGRTMAWPKPELRPRGIATMHMTLRQAFTRESWPIETFGALAELLVSTFGVCSSGLVAEQSL